MHDLRAASLLKQDIAGTLGATYQALVDRHIERLLPFADWSEDVLAARVIDDVQQEVHNTFVDTSWPHCPMHPHHPLWYEDGAWRCSERGAAVAALGDLDVVLFNDAIEGWRRGDFDRLAPLFAERADGPIIARWHAAGRFASHPAELAEALSNAAFLGRTGVVTYLLDAGVDVTAGTACGMDALHWAANRGKADAVRLLIERGAPLESINMHGTTALGTAVWSAVNEPWWGSAQIEIIELLLESGADIRGAAYPSGVPELDRMLEAHGAERM